MRDVERKEQFRLALEKQGHVLTPAKRAVMRLEAENYRYHVIVERLSMTVNTAGQLIFHARKWLAGKMPPTFRKPLRKKKPCPD